MGLKLYALLCSNISNLYCFEYIPESGKTICALLYQYVKCLLLCIYPCVGVNMHTFIQQYFKYLFRIYPRVGVNNMRTFIQQYFKYLLFRICPRVDVGKNHMCILHPHVKCLLFRIYSRVGVNNMYTFRTAIFQMFIV